MFAQPALHLTIRSIFQFVTPLTSDHELVIKAGKLAGGAGRSVESAGRLVGPPSRLITSIAVDRTGPEGTRNCPRTTGTSQANRTAAISPGVARRFPFFAALRTRRPGSSCFGDGAIGETSNDHQSRRARGVDS